MRPGRQTGRHPAPGDADKPKTGRHKKRVVKKQDVLETRENELRGGRFQEKTRVLPGKEVAKPRSRFQRRANALSKFPKWLPSAICRVRWASKPAT